LCLRRNLRNVDILAQYLSRIPSGVKRKYPIIILSAPWVHEHDAKPVAQQRPIPLRRDEFHSTAQANEEDIALKLL
jgi:hypothetical protein